MNSNIVVKSLEELGNFTELFSEPDSQSAQPAVEPITTLPSDEDLTHLADTVSEAMRELQSLMEQDGRARERAEESLERYRRLERMRTHVAQLNSDARAIADTASTLSDLGFDPRCRDRATRLVQLAAHVETSPAFA